MKKTATLGALLLALALPLAAQAETVFAGEVTAGTTQVIAAPYGGLVEDVRVRVGDSVKIGDPIATVETSKTYASTDGTVSGVFAREGDSADGVKTQYGALVYIEPINRYTLECSTEKGYNSSENRYIHIGESVFLKCTKDGSHQGRGVVTGLDEKEDNKFTVEVTGGEFYMGETVDIYRSEDYASASRIGRGTVGRTKTVAVNAEGSVLKMHVKAGDTVERGELLFETVTGTLDGLYAPRHGGRDCDGGRRQRHERREGREDRDDLPERRHADQNGHIRGGSDGCDRRRQGRNRVQLGRGQRPPL